MNIRIFSFPVFSFQLNSNNIDGVVTNSKTPRIIMSIDKIINTFIIYYNCTPAPLRNAAFSSSGHLGFTGKSKLSYKLSLYLVDERGAWAEAGL